MKIAVASFEYEGNTFSLTRAGEDDFARRILAFGDAVLPEVEGRGLALSGGCDELRKAGAELLPVVVAHGGSGGAVTDAFFDRIRETFASGFAGAGRLDGVYLAMHGAMICQSHDDPEGEILALVRQIVGPDVPIAVSLDLHANVTPLKVDSADILVGYETYPHNDVEETGRRAARLLIRTVRGEIRPVMAQRRINGFVPVIGGSTDAGQPMAEVRAAARAFETSGAALSVSYFPVQPWLDIADVGICGIAITDGAPDSAREIATAVVLEMWDRRSAYYVPHHTAEQAIAEARGMTGPVALLDAADCVGGGSSGDQAGLLAAILEHAPDLPSAVLLVDREAAEACHAAGAGATLALELGSTLDARFNPPVSVEASVLRLSDGRFSYDGGPMAGPSGNMGPSALVQAGQTRIVIASHPTYDYADEQFRALGVDWRSMRLVVFKNPMNFRNALDPSMHWIGVNSLGATAPRLEELDWHRKQRPFWPFDDADEPPFF